MSLAGKLKPSSENTESIFLASFAGQWGLYKDPLVLQGGARPPPKVLLNFLKSNYDFGEVIIWQTHYLQGKQISDFYYGN